MKPLTPTTPHMIIMVGIPGSGKTHFASHFAKTFNAPYVNQAELQSLANTDDTRATTIAARVLDEILKTQRTLVYEGPTHLRTVRQSLVKKAHQAGYEPLLVWVQTETTEAKHRFLKAEKGREAEVHDRIVARFSRPHPTEKAVVISGKHTYASQVKVVLKHLAHARPEQPPQERPTRPGRRLTVR